MPLERELTIEAYHQGPSQQVRLSIDWPQPLKQFFINVLYHILVASITLMALF